MNKKQELVICRSKDGGVHLDIQMKKDTLWLSLDQLAALFDRDKSVISRHLRNIFKTHELERDAVIAKNATSRPQEKEVITAMLINLIGGRK